jgi:hypothetical protein
VCNCVFKWGYYNLWIATCPYCGTGDFNPKLVDKGKFLEFERKKQSMGGTATLQKKYWLKQVLDDLKAKYGH